MSKSFKTFDMVPKGRLIMIRNTDVTTTENEKETTGGFLHQIFQLLCDRKDEAIEFITTVSNQKKQTEKKYTEELQAAGYLNFNFLYLDKEQNCDEQLLDRLSQAKAVIFTDEQPKLCEVLKDSSILKLLYRKYLLEEDFTIVGINIGAMCISGIFMNDSAAIEGLGFINTCIVDACFDYKIHFKNLIKTVILNNECFGLGMGENTALIIEKGDRVLCKGNGTVMFLNARNVKKCNANDFDKGKTMFVKNLKGHILVDGCMLNLTSGEVINTLHKTSII